MNTQVTYRPPLLQRLPGYVSATSAVVATAGMLYLTHGPVVEKYAELQQTFQDDFAAVYLLGASVLSLGYTMIKKNTRGFHLDAKSRTFSVVSAVGKKTYDFIDLEIRTSNDAPIFQVRHSKSGLRERFYEMKLKAWGIGGITNEEARQEEDVWGQHHRRLQVKGVLGIQLTQPNGQRNFMYMVNAVSQLEGKINDALNNGFNRSR